MKILGFQEITLLDFPGKVASIVFTGGCNFRCPFCHNSSIVVEDEDEMDEDSILAYFKEHKKMLDGVVVTGGEPLIQPDIENFIVKIKNLGLAVKLDTNGYMPDALQNLIDKNLIDYIAMDIKNTKEKYAKTVGHETIDMKKIERSIEIIKNSGIDYEFRTTVVRELHNFEDFEKIANWIAPCKRYYLQAFKENENTFSHTLSAYSAENMQNIQDVVSKIIPNTRYR